MSITDELRDWFKDRMFMGNGWQEIHDIADRIDAEHERVVRERRRGCVYYDPERHYCSCHDFDVSGYVELPKDADGEHIQAGDVLDGYGKTIEVVELRYGRSGWVLISRDGNAYADTFAFTHYHAPTVEDVLQKLLEQAVGYSDAHTTVALDAIAEYAAKLRLAESEDA